MLMRVEGPQGELISVSVADQGGRVQVAVRSNDAATASLLRQDLPSLTNTLEHLGWKGDMTMGATPPANLAMHAFRTDTGEPPHEREESQLAWNPEPEHDRNSPAELWEEALAAHDGSGIHPAILNSRYL